MASICFNTPAYGRLAVSRVVFAQRRRACDALIMGGHDATAVIVADDGNLGLAEEFGFEPVNEPNHFLGSKWNAGYEVAAELGADYVMPVGSDSLLDPALIEHWLSLKPNEHRIPFTTHYSVVRRDGLRRLDCVVTKGGGGGMMFSRSQLERVDFRPVENGLQSGCDHSTLKALSAKLEFGLEPHDVHPLAVVALQSSQQITSYDGLAKRWGVHEVRGRGVVGELAAVYGEETASDAGFLYASKRRQRA